MPVGRGFIDRRCVLNAALREHFPLFIQKVFEELCPCDKFEYGWHLDAIAHQLERISNGDIRRLITTIPPRNLKSITISIAWVAWSIGKAPEKRFVCLSYSHELSDKLSRDCRQVMQSAWYREIFPNVVLARCTDTEIETTMGGGRLATSVGGGFTGRGADVIIIDDPLKADDATSATARQGAQEWLASTIFSRLNDKRIDAVILVMQRLHEDDPAGYFLERGGWEHLNLPAICEEEQHIPLIGGRIHVRRVGDVLHPEREPLDTLEQTRREVGAQVFSAQYQQSPIPAGGALIRRDWLKYYDVPPQKLTGDVVGQSWDTASKTGPLSDYSVCITFLVRNKTVYILKVFRERLNFPELLRMVQQEAELYRPDVLLVEDAASGQQLIQTLNAEPLAFVPAPIACKPDGDKVIRLSANCPLIESGELVLPKEAPWLGDFLREVLGFPSGKFDDQADALSQLLTWTRCRTRPIINAQPGGYLADGWEIEDGSWDDDHYDPYRIC